MCDIISVSITCQRKPRTQKNTCQKVPGTQRIHFTVFEIQIGPEENRFSTRKKEFLEFAFGTKLKYYRILYVTCVATKSYENLKTAPRERTEQPRRTDRNYNLFDGKYPSPLRPSCQFFRVREKRVTTRTNVGHPSAHALCCSRLHSSVIILW